MANNADTLQRSFDNYCRIMVLLTEVIANPTQQNIDTLLSTSENLGVVRPKVTTQIDGKAYNWGEYQQQVMKIMTDLRQMIIWLQGPYEVRSIGG